MASHPRTLTAAERRLWREATRHDEKLLASDAVEDVPEAPAVSDPSPAIMRTAPAPKPPRKTPVAPLTVQVGRHAVRLRKPYGPITATLDLHGADKIAAHGLVADFIRRAQAAGHRHVCIITGKGRSSAGVLRAQLPHWLNEAPLRALVAGLAQAGANNGGLGALHVLLKRNRHDHD